MFSMASTIPIETNRFGWLKLKVDSNLLELVITGIFGEYVPRIPFY